MTGGWGPFEGVEFARAFGMEPMLTLSAAANTANDWADLVEYCWGDSESTYWGQQRFLDRGIRAPYNVSIFELGNEEYPADFIEQMAAMEARAQKLSKMSRIGALPELFYVFPNNQGPSAMDAERALKLELPVERILVDLHVLTGGGATEAIQLFQNPTVSGFEPAALIGETNACTHDMQRALHEAIDLIALFNMPQKYADRLHGRMASFCAASMTQNDGSGCDQGMAFFTPQEMWLQPPGHVHAGFARNWASKTVAVAAVGEVVRGVHITAQCEPEDKNGLRGRRMGGSAWVLPRCAPWL